MKRDNEREITIHVDNPDHVQEVKKIASAIGLRTLSWRSRSVRVTANDSRELTDLCNGLDACIVGFLIEA